MRFISLQILPALNLLAHLLLDLRPTHTQSEPTPIPTPNQSVKAAAFYVVKAIREPHLMQALFPTTCIRI